MSNPALGVHGLTSVQGGQSGAMSSPTGKNSQATWSSFVGYAFIYGNSSTPTISDTFSNNWSVSSKVQDSNDGQTWVWAWIAQGGSGGTNHEVTVTPFSGQVINKCGFIEIENTSALDGSPVTAFSNFSTSLSNPITPTVANDLIIGIAGSGTNYSNVIATTTSGWANIDQNDWTATDSSSLTSAYIANATISAQDPAWNSAPNGSIAAITMAFMPVTSTFLPLQSGILT